MIPRHVVYTKKRRVLRIDLDVLSSRICYTKIDTYVTACIIDCVRYCCDSLKRHVDVRCAARSRRSSNFALGSSYASRNMQEFLSVE